MICNNKIIYRIKEFVNIKIWEQICTLKAVLPSGRLGIDLGGLGCYTVIHIRQSAMKYMTFQSAQRRRTAYDKEDNIF